MHVIDGVREGRGMVPYDGNARVQVAGFAGDEN
jgi:hypothetical protein